MSVAAARADLVATLEDTGLPVCGYGTSKINRPLIIIDEGQPFLEYSDVFGQFNINFVVYLFTDTKNLEASTKEMDQMVQSSVLNLGEWALTNLESHIRTVLQEGGPVYLVSKLSVTNQINLEIGD